jgi:hypoxanthine-guanine phosphoribosyltransferase
MQELRRRGAACVRSLVLLRKAGRAEVAIQPDFVGFDIPKDSPANGTSASVGRRMSGS